jgi:two-component system sensor histidine kinase DesK
VRARSTDRPGRPSSALPDGPDDKVPAPRLASVILHIALLCYAGITAINIMERDLSPGELAVALACLAAIYGVQLFHSSARGDGASGPVKSLTLGAQTLLTYLPLAAYGMYWGAMAGFLAGSVLLLLPGRWAWPLYGLIGVSMIVPPYLDGAGLLDMAYSPQATLLTGLVTFGLTRLSQVIRALHDTREELGRMAVAAERLRFARDLHDLLGYSLSAITLKGELVHRLIPTAPERAAAEIEEVLVISRQSLADVRAVASGYRSLSLADEIRAAGSTLASAGIEAHTEARTGPVDPRVDTVLATVLREAVTNILRHSNATRCAIDAVRDGARVRLTVANDGVTPGYVDDAANGGSGLENLDVRLRSVGGSLARVRESATTFVLVAEAPAEPDMP